MPNLADIDNLVLDDIKIGQPIRELKQATARMGPRIQTCHLLQPFSASLQFAIFDADVIECLTKEIEICVSPEAPVKVHS